MSKKKRNKWGWKEKHYAQIWTAMKKVLDAESWSDPLSDRRMTEAIRDQAVYTTPTITRAVREIKKIGTAEERRVELFAKSRGK